MCGQGAPRPCVDPSIHPSIYPSTMLSIHPSIPPSLQPERHVPRTFSCFSLIRWQAAVKVLWYCDSSTTYPILNFSRPRSSGTTLLI